MWRFGNKSKLAKLIVPYFPEHDLYIELFFGGGGMFFNKPKAKYNILNDNDNFLINFYRVIIDDNKREDLLDRFEMWLEHNELLKEEQVKYRNSNFKDEVDKALCFVLMSRMCFMGNGNSTMIYDMRNNKKLITEKIKDNYKLLINNVKVMNKNFRDVIKTIGFTDKGVMSERDKETGRIKKDDRNRAFIYADPPYLNTANNYKDGFKEQDLIDLFNVLINSKIKFAISHYEHPIFLELCKKHNLQVIHIMERYGLQTKKDNELLAINYDCDKQLKMFEE